MTLIFAHRGAAGTYPENTMVSFEAAEAFRADGIELDVQLTKDGKVVVIHDETVIGQQMEKVRFEIIYMRIYVSWMRVINSVIK